MHVARVAGCLFLLTACVSGDDPAATDAGRDARIDVPNTGCPTNWLPVAEADLGTRARVEDGALVLRGDAAELELRGLIGATPGKGFIFRFEIPVLDLGPDGRLDLDFTAPQGTVATLIIENEGAVLMVESFPSGANVEMPFARPPTRLVVELESRPDFALAARAFYFEAADGKVQEAAVDRFNGGLITPTLTLTGPGSELHLDRVARVDADGGGDIDDFACDSLGLAFDRDAWPEVRAARPGKACSDDTECGAGELCRAEVCRRRCLASAACPDSICLVTASDASCRLPSERGCANLGDGLTCGPDDTARLACPSAADCPRPDDLCLAGACVSNDEDAASDGAGWGSCTLGAERCRVDEIEVCDVGGPGWNHVQRCGAGECVAEAGDARCDDCVQSCEGGDVVARCGGATTPTVVEDCPSGSSACSTGDDARDPPYCRALVAAEAAPAGVLVGAPSGFRIDPTEVTRAAYATFLEGAPNPATQPATCAWNTSFVPADWPWFTSPHRAVQVDFCDARAYCASLGRHLCTTEAWLGACSAGGALAFPYGATFEAGRCSNDTKRDVATSPGCTTTVVGFTGTWDLIGGVGEWLDACKDGSGASAAADTCKTRGTLPVEPCTAERSVRRDSMAGIRCCGP